MVGKLARSQRTLAPRAVPKRGLKVGDLLASKYRVQRLLGEGGMGLVVEAYHELLEQHVAVKLLYQDVADREAQSRLLLEARSAAKLRSEHVARVIDVDVGADGLPFIVMELLEGADLCQIADSRGALPCWLVVDYILQALEGLAHAHGRGIIHRDLKPSNLFLANRPDGSQVIKILDFGISKSQNNAVDRKAAQLTGGHAVLGSPPYMSPEQVRSPTSVDHRTDIWSLGICMYELLTNAMPFGGAELQETFAQILENEPTPIGALATAVPDGLAHVVMKCLSKNREDRYSDVAELAKALAPFGSGMWVQYVDRVQATLTRALMDDMTGGSRVRAPSGNQIAIGSSRRFESMQPELTGTASTVAHGFTVFESKKRWILGLSLVIAFVGFTLIGVSYIRRSQAPAGDAYATDPPESAVEAPAAPASIVVAPVPLQSAPADSELPAAALPQSTVPGSPSAAASVGAASKVKPAAPVGRPLSGTAVSAKKAAPGGSKSLPPGLPQTRSGQ